MGSFGSLNFDVLSAILEYVDDSSPHTTKDSICFVNKHLNAVAQHIIHRQKRISLSDPIHAHQVLERWLENSKILSGLRYLTVDGYWPHGQAPTEQVAPWPNLIKLLSELSNLRVCTYKAHVQLPLAFLDTLHQKHPMASLRIFQYKRREITMGPNDPAELALTASPALISFSGSIWSSAGEEDCDLREAAMRRIIATAPNLRFASVEKGQSGCVVRGFSREALARQQDQERPFRTTRPNKSVRALHLDGFGSSEHTLKDWGKVVDLSSLERLKCSRGVPDASFFRAAPILLPNLSQLSVNFQTYHNGPPNEIAGAAQTYLVTCPPLKSISLWSWDKFVPLDVVLRHGPKLTTLELHEREMPDVGPPRRQLSTEELVQVRECCPVLRDLTLDIDRENAEGKGETINPKKYAELAAFPHLNRLQIYFDLGIAWENNIRAGASAEAPSYHYENDWSDGDGDGTPDPKPPNRNPVPCSQPQYWIPYVKNLWRTVFATRQTGPRELDVKNGEVERKVGVGYPASWVIWEQSNSSHWRVLPNERDDMRDQPVLTVVKGKSELDEVRKRKSDSGPVTEQMGERDVGRFGVEFTYSMS